MAAIDGQASACTEAMGVQGRSKTKIIPLMPEVKVSHPTGAQTKKEILHDQYVEGLTALSKQLCDMAMRFGEEPKQVLFDLTYVIVGNDIVETFRRWDSDTDET